MTRRDSFREAIAKTIRDETGFGPRPSSYQFADAVLAMPEMEAIREAWSYVHFLLDFGNLWSEEGCFTFPDGATIWKNESVTVR